MGDDFPTEPQYDDRGLIKLPYPVKLSKIIALCAWPMFFVACCGGLHPDAVFLVLGITLWMLAYAGGLEGENIVLFHLGKEKP